MARTKHSFRAGSRYFVDRSFSNLLEVPSAFCLLPSAFCPSAPLPRLLQFPDLPLHQLALQRTHLVEKNDAVAVVGLVEHAASGKFFVVKLKLVSVDVMRPHYCAQATLNRSEDPRKRKTTFLAVLLAFNVYHIRVNHHDALVGVLATRAVHYEQTPGYPDLDRSQPDTGRRVHRLKHIADELLQIVTKLRDRIS